MMDKKALKDKGAAALKAVKELEAAFESFDPKIRVELNTYARELSSKLKDAGKHFTMASRFKILKKRGRPSGSTKKSPAKRILSKKPVAAKASAKRPAAKKPTAKVVPASTMDHPDISLRPQN